MASTFPMDIRKIATNCYSFELAEESIGNSHIKSKWKKTFIGDINDLLELKSRIDKLIEEIPIMEILKLRFKENEAKLVNEHWENDTFCQNCNYKKPIQYYQKYQRTINTCRDCLFVCQSPLERQLYLEFLKSGFRDFKLQYGLDRQGNNVSVIEKSYENSQNNFKDVLTIVDFYIEVWNTNEKKYIKLCIYADGHTYHERTEEQAMKDKQIDRKLQELGYTVLRYTGKEIRENISNVISDIKRHLGIE